MKKILKLAIAAVLTLAIVFSINEILLIKRADGITPMKHLYAQEENTVDVLFLGSSHTGMNIDLPTLWEERGMAGFSLWGSMQPFWNSYYFFQEALKTQTPAVVVLDVYMAAFEEEYSDDARQVTNVCGMRFNRNRWEAARVSAPKERRLDLFLGLPLYHTRYAELTEEDFSFFPGSPGLITEKGSSFRYGTGDVEIQDVSGIAECQPLLPKAETYLRRIIELCQARDLPIVLLKTPSGEPVREQPYYNSIQKIAQEYGIPFLNYNLLHGQTGLTAQDFWTDDLHLNTEGSRKITRHLGSWLSSHYSIPDRSGSPRHQSWTDFSESIRQGYLQAVAEAEALPASP